MLKESFGTLKDGNKSFVYTLENKNGIKARVTDYGAILVSVLVPDRDGKEVDVVLGYDNVTEYENHGYYFGAVIGRNGNRIADAKININGKEYELEKNDNGRNNLHSGSHCTSFMLWDVKEYHDNMITLTCTSKDGEQGFPGNMKMEITYELTEDNVLELKYQAESDQDTVANLTNHSYFNLAGHGSGFIGNQELVLYATNYTPVVDAESIPTGELAPVEGTPMDFRTAKPMGKDMEADFDQLHFTGGYDHNYVLDKKEKGAYELMAEAYSPETGITMKAYTDLPAVQFYAGNYIDEHVGKQGAAYAKRTGFCLESQYFPNAINEPKFESPLLKAGDTYRTKTGYQFGVRN